jgi:PAS domain S-box-containing protein
VSELDFGPILNTLDVGIIVLDGAGRIVEWNDWIARAAGRPRDAALGQSLYDLFPALRETRLPAAVDDSFAFGSASILTHSLNRLLPLHGEDGRELLHNVVVRPLATAPLRHCLLQIDDVTVSVTRERVLRERQNARYHAIVDSAPDAIITTGVDRVIQWLNGGAERIFGYKASELLGQKIDILMESDGALLAAFADEAAGAGQSRQSLQVVGRRRHGALAYFDVSFGHWRAEDRMFVTTIWRDVSERMAVELALRDSEGRHRALLEALPQLVWTCGPDGDCDYFNPQWQGYTGTSAEQNFGSGWLDVIHPEDLENLMGAWNAALVRKEIFDVDARLRRADGEFRWFKMRSIPVRNADEEVTRWFGTATDITDLVQARDALRSSNEELEVRVAERTREREVVIGQLHEAQKMEMIGQLTGGMAHDFNNLLAIILGSLTLLRKGLPEDPRTTRLLEGAIQGAERGALLTKRLLAFARRQELKLEAVDVQTLIPGMLDFLRQSVGPGVVIQVDIAPDVHPVRIDANQLELALMNLAVNARDAMPKGGTLTITARNESDPQTGLPVKLPRGDYVRIGVSDTGEGMSAATLAKAMEPFFTTKGVGKGTGLGLSMVHGLSAQAGGAMHMASELGKGAVVTLWLPRAEEADVAKPAEVRIRPDEVGRRLRVLLVDDDALVSLNTTYMLMDLGHSVMEASSAAQALRLLEADGQFDAVVTDYAMPGMNGLDLAIKIRNLRPKLPIVLATGYAETPLHGAVGFPRLSKPYSQDELSAALREAMSISEA